ncbi:SAM-dependent methyltransferases [Formosa agariphila KMM 3901]|uniref:SAM-dependent methyltransferases n=1 Tax=Formosa agariphila (strain DSM 15362 / KCTC 12365 / LMG 23005 / KMM 3901 / M-2Alg 35-1) TaxID=1347342 RepID=T2KJG9_FORAG|nr:RsmD family RNA methyltransferase [Formosa agariphila]CDF79037.1 SAM-dependent methyltransferases [Formosa agariphila KMM 3901]
MNTSILNTEIQRFINENLKSNISSILLKGTPFEGVETREIVEQIEAKSRCISKLESWYNTPNIYYPNKLNIEQTSSEHTANYKAALLSGVSILDITGGFGVDCFAFSKRFKQVTHCEINSDLSNIVAHNYKQLQIDNIETVAENGITYLKNTTKVFDWIYVDPSRRHDSKGKVFFLNDCLPNVPEQLDVLFKHGKQILVKTSPLLDIAIGTQELKFVKSVYVIALNNDVKELLWVLDKNATESFTIHTANITKTTVETFNFPLELEGNLNVAYSKPLNYLYEPNSAILKAGAFNSIADQLNLFKLHKHSHLYTSEGKTAFPGRIFQIVKTIPFNKKAIQKEGIKKANITTRNFQDSVSDLRKKLKIKDGGDLYLFFTTDLDSNKIVLICKKA